eukprot:03273.XXX_25141_25356_1 [CDS] Oithona nana genome sequencing.
MTLFRADVFLSFIHQLFEDIDLVRNSSNNHWLTRRHELTSSTSSPPLRLLLEWKAVLHSKLRFFFVKVKHF